MDLKNLKKLILTSKFPSQGHAFQFLLRWAVEDLDEVEHLDFYDFLKNAIQILPFLTGNELHSLSEETRSDILQGQALFRGVKQLLIRGVW